LLQLLGRYQVHELLGQGAMADVYRAYDPQIDRVLAVKVLKGEFRENRQYANRFLREAKAAGALSHPNIVTIHDVGEVDGYPYIVMELLDGEPLDRVAGRLGRLPVDDVMAIGLQLAEALHYAHGQGVVHRDIKPSNILLGADGRTIKILDFGIARTAEVDRLADDAEALKTQFGQVLGTPRYMSPEQAMGHELDGRSDLFSVGVVLYELITGRKAFSGVSPVTLALQITQQDPMPIHDIAPDAPRGLQFIIGKLLAKRPERRFADGGQLAEALRREQSAIEATVAETDGHGRNLPLQARVTLLMTSITATALLVATSAVLNQQYHAMERMALTSGSAITSFVASNAALSAADNAALPAAERDWMPVEAFVQQAAKDPNIRDLTVVDADGVVRAASDPVLVGQRYIPPVGERRVQHAGDAKVTLDRDNAGFRFVRPITYAGRTFGMVDVNVSKAGLEAAAGLSRLLLFGLAFLTLGVVVAGSYAVARLLAAPIRRLKTALADAAAGDLDFRISHQRKDEFGDLFDAFNRLSTEMQTRLEAAAASPTARKAAARRAIKAVAATPDPFPAGADPDATQIADGAPAAVELTVIGGRI
jgi:serine/threonine-protein kinase